MSVDPGVEDPSAAKHFESVVVAVHFVSVPHSHVLLVQIFEMVSAVPQAVALPHLQSLEVHVSEFPVQAAALPQKQLPKAHVSVVPLHVTSLQGSGKEDGMEYIFYNREGFSNFILSLQNVLIFRTRKIFSNTQTCGCRYYRFYRSCRLNLINLKTSLKTHGYHFHDDE